ncbi:MAG: hypothetical protein L6R42_001737 [Xanthoria sp. 1 TBL-2021]|nr:MAG: hypothetical protein L6R42_001737 [Xanthoria sp. 1 TBL-2021]
MDLSSQRRIVIDITNSDDDQDVRLEDLMTPEELQAAVQRSLELEIPDVPLTPEHDDWNPHPPQNGPNPALAPYDQCLQKVLEVFPDVSHDFVKNLYDRHPPDTPSPDGIPVSEEIISQVLDCVNYPKERDRQNELKRKRADSDDEKAAKWASISNVTRPDYDSGALDALVDDFPDIPRKFIELKFREIGNLYAVYLALDIADDTFNTSAPRPYTRLRRARKPKPGPTATSPTMNPTGYGLTELQKELEAARAQRKKLQTQRQIKRDAIAAEAAEEQELRDNKQVLECGSCFDEVPINKITFCNGDEPHSACFECATTWVKTKIGESRYQLPCIVGAECKGTYSRHERTRFLEPQMIERLERLEQQTCLREANLPNLEECPFCDFAAECPPIEMDKEFRCGNTECQKVSCRRCKVATHIPLSCEEFKKENGLTERHQIEEARTQALLRQCPRCKKTIMKEGGCNKMTCSCGAYICDYCGKDITTQVYGHFSDGPTSLRIPGVKRCPTYDDDYTRNKQNMDKAEKEAQEKIRKENPNISEEDLKIKMKESVRSPVSRSRQLPYAGLPPQAVARMMAAEAVRHHAHHMPPMPAAGFPGMPGNFPQGYLLPNHGVPNAGPPVGLFAPPVPPRPLGPQEVADIHNARRRHAQPGGYVPDPRRHRRDAVADQGGRMQHRAQAGGHPFYPFPDGDGIDYFAGDDDEMDHQMRDYLEMMEEVEPEPPRRRRH